MQEQRPKAPAVKLCGYVSVICAVLALFVLPILAIPGALVGIVGCLLPPRGANRFGPGAGIILSALAIYLTIMAAYWL